MCSAGIWVSFLLVTLLLFKQSFSGRADKKGIWVGQWEEKEDYFLDVRWKRARGGCQSRGARAWEPYRRGDYRFMAALMQLANRELGGPFAEHWMKHTSRDKVQGISAQAASRQCQESRSQNKASVGRHGSLAIELQPVMHLLGLISVFNFPYQSHKEHL